MAERKDAHEAEVTARRLMRQGCDDEEISVRTGLSMMRLLALRAGAAVEETQPHRTPPVGETGTPG